MIEAHIYKALGDPIRLKMVQRLAGGRSCTIGELSENLGVSRQGARKQLQVLVDADVIHLSRHGRKTHAVLDPKTLEVASAFITRLERQWDARLNQLKRFAENMES